MPITEGVCQEEAISSCQGRRAYEHTIDSTKVISFKRFPVGQLVDFGIPGKPASPASESPTPRTRDRNQTGCRVEQAGPRPIHLAGTANHQHQGEREETEAVPGTTRASRQTT